MTSSMAERCAASHSFDNPPCPPVHPVAHMNPSRRIARDLKACIFAGPILLLMWVAKGCG